MIKSIDSDNSASDVDNYDKDGNFIGENRNSSIDIMRRWEGRQISDADIRSL